MKIDLLGIFLSRGVAQYVSSGAAADQADDLLLTGTFLLTYPTFCKHSGQIHVTMGNLCLQKLITVFIDCVSGRDAGVRAMSGE